MKFVFFALCSILSFNLMESARQIQLTNKCGYPLWVNPAINLKNGVPLYPNLAGGMARLNNGSSYIYNIPDSGWGGRFWPKSGCNSNGQQCEVGQSVAPCGTNGCDPPADTKVEFFFPKVNDPAETWYDVSLVDGYSVAAEIIPNVQRGSCIKTRCAVKLNQCPNNENDVGDLRVRKNGRVVSCLSPCKKWNYPAPFGLGRSEFVEPGAHLCCPTPPIWSPECRAGLVDRTKYVNLIHRDCPTAYSYAYDDDGGLHKCPSNTNFRVTFCP